VTAQVEREYVLGTDEVEIQRLGLQHRIWREPMLAAWRRAGIGPRYRVVDVGAGPGHASLDLAEWVGSEGEVLAIERSHRFASALERQCHERGLTQVRVLEGDLMSLAPEGEYDVAWCRWVASFVESPRTLVAWLARVLRKRGRVVFHEYADYGSWRLAPRRPILEEFVAEVMTSWRAAGGEPDVALELPGLLQDAGFEIVGLRPLVFAARSQDPVWQWPAAFVDVNLERLQALGRVSGEWATRVRTELRKAERNPASVMLTPLVLEIIAERG